MLLGMLRERGFTSHPAVTGTEVLWYLAPSWGPHGPGAAEMGPHAASCQRREKPGGEESAEYMEMG